VLDRWHRRFQRAPGFWHDSQDERFADTDKQFSNLITVLTAAAYVEGLLYLGVQFAGLRVVGKKTMSLGTLIGKAEKLGVVDGALARRLRGINNIRNGTAHDPDYAVTDVKVGELYGLLTPQQKAALQPAFRNILPESTADVVMALSFE
jgi:hypothetical protein